MPTRKTISIYPAMKILFIKVSTFYYFALLLLAMIDEIMEDVQMGFIAIGQKAMDIPGNVVSLVSYFAYYSFIEGPVGNILDNMGLPDPVIRAATETAKDVFRAPSLMERASGAIV